MILNAVIDDQMYQLNVPEFLIEDALPFFQRMDQDMAAGVQMSREWVSNPSLEQRCQVVANKLLTALENENHNLGRMMAGYLLSRIPNLDFVEIDTSGEISATRFKYLSLGDAPINQDTMAQAESRVSNLFKAGRQWKFSVHDKVADQWRDSPAIGTEEAAKNLRKQAVERIYLELQQSQ